MQVRQVWQQPATTVCITGTPTESNTLAHYYTHIHTNTRDTLTHWHSNSVYHAGTLTLPVTLTHWHTGVKHIGTQAQWNSGTLWNTPLHAVIKPKCLTEHQQWQVHTLVCFSHDHCMHTGCTKAPHYTLQMQGESVTKRKNRQRFHHCHRHCRSTAAHAVCDIALLQNKQHGSF